MFTCLLRTVQLLSRFSLCYPSRQFSTSGIPDRRWFDQFRYIIIKNVIYWHIINTLFSIFLATHVCAGYFCDYMCVFDHRSVLCGTVRSVYGHPDHSDWNSGILHRCGLEEQAEVVPVRYW